MSLLYARRSTAAIHPRRVLGRCMAIILPYYRAEVARPQTISSLNPLELRSKDYIDASGLEPLNIVFHHTRGSDQLWYNLSRISNSESRESLPFPPASKGFLYYHNDLHSPFESGLRLRLTSGNGSPPSLFASGQDLVAPDGAPWHISLPALASHSDNQSHLAILEQLLRENVVTQEQIAQHQTLFGKRWKQWAPRIITRLTQEFPVDFSGILVATIVANGAVHNFKLGHVFRVEQGPAQWTGSAIVRFEPSTLRKYRGKRVLHLRILRIVTPVEPNATERRDVRIAKPEPGELLTILSPRSSRTPRADTDVPADVELDADAGLEREPWAYSLEGPRRTASAKAVLALWKAHELKSKLKLKS
ncbi:hypothetical protein B0H16DRAFT_1686028 [Mycena metata]|uniref:Uncharacterized protein n=1 Tax=Mycena metata TaxID=1033252 RepID=A0AAD7JQW3_9AGAR|nr:hypothetical protein B0H16DRAFT_1686028 [Mycena metata]